MLWDDVSRLRAKVSAGFTNVSSLAVSAFVLDCQATYIGETGRNLCTRLTNIVQ